MKYCVKCGNELLDEAVICPKCGCATGYVSPTQCQAPAPQKPTDTQNAAKAFMIVMTVINSLCGWLIPLAWCLPMTISYCKKIQNGEKVSTGFKVCSLLFVGLIPGIIMLCDKD